MSLVIRAPVVAPVIRCVTYGRSSLAVCFSGQFCWAHEIGCPRGVTFWPLPRVEVSHVPGLWRKPVTFACGPNSPDYSPSDGSRLHKESLAETCNPTPTSHESPLKTGGTQTHPACRHFLRTVLTLSNESPPLSEVCTYPSQWTFKGLRPWLEQG